MITEKKDFKKKDKEPIEDSVVNIPPLASESSQEVEKFVKPIKAKGLSKFKMMFLIFVFLSLFLFVTSCITASLNIGLSFKIVATTFMFIFCLDLLHSFKFFFKC